MCQGITYKSEFEERLAALGFDFQHYESHSSSFILTKDGSRKVTAQLVGSEPLGGVIHRSNNGNEITAIGYFKLNLQNKAIEPDFFILAFENTINKGIEFIIIPTEEIMRRFLKNNRKSKGSHKISIVFWLMDDRFLYECTDVAVEWEWFYLSRGVNGRMADGSDWDYSKFLNDWNRLKI